jgi:hypothetical protein
MTTRAHFTCDTQHPTGAGSSHPHTHSPYDAHTGIGVGVSNPKETHMKVERMCPVCYQRARKTVRGNIGAHIDTAGIDGCPGSGLPYSLAVIGRRRPGKVAS